MKYKIVCAKFVYESGYDLDSFAEELGRLSKEGWEPVWFWHNNPDEPGAICAILRRKK